jgi:GlpG protein
VVTANQVPAVYQWLMAPYSLDMLLAQPWRIITPVLIHFGLMHIIFNLLWWWILGGIIERTHSARVLVLLLLVTGLAGNGAQYLVAGPGFGGLSGVVYGLFGYLWAAGWASGDRGQQMPRSVAVWLVGWLVLSALVFPDVIATAAHVGGLVSGGLYGGLVGAWRRQRG